MLTVLQQAKYNIQQSKTQSCEFLLTEQFEIVWPSFSLRPEMCCVGCNDVDER